jgi:outer membrane protein insertion porin family
VLNRLSLRPGDIVDTRELQASERRLKASGLFMVDPSKGIQPKIVFNPPDSEDKDKESDGGSSVARKPKRQTTFYRGPGDGVTSLPPLPPGERYLDVVLPGGDWGQVEPPPQFAGPQQSAPGQVPAGVWGNDLRDVRQAQAVGQAWERQGVESRGYGTYSSYGSHASYPSQGHMHTAGQGGGMVAPGIGKLETCPTGPGKLEAYPTVPSYPPAPPPDGPVEPMEEPIVVRGQYTADAMSAPPTTSPGFAAPTNSYPPPNRAPQGYGPSYPPQTTVVAPGYNYAPNNNYAAPPANAVPSSGPAPANGQQWYSPTPPPGQQFQQGPAVAPNQQLGTVGAPRPYPPAGITPPISDRVFGDPAYTTPTPNGEPLRDLPLFIRTDENQTGRLMFGVGVNSDAGVVGSVVLDEQNFDWTRFPTSWEEVRNATAWRGAGQKFRVELVPGTQVQRYMINFQEPYLGYSDVSLGLSAFYFDRIYTEWRENRVGGRISLGYQLTHDLSVNTAFRGMNVHLTPYNDFQTIPIIEQSSGNNGLYGFQVSLAHDTRDNPFLATQGHLLSASFEQVVGKFKYPRAEIEASQYFKLYERPDGSGRHVLSLTTHVGYTGDNTPVYERFFAGGFSSLRGFRFRGVSPVEYTNSGLRASVGGNFELLASIQYLFPITADDMLRGVVFCDTGTVEPSISDWNAHYRVAPGFGLRIVIPALGPAPIALDFAFPVSKQNGDQTEMFSFFVGFNR